MRRFILGAAGLVTALLIVLYAWFLYPTTVAEPGGPVPTATSRPGLLAEPISLPVADASPGAREHGFFPLLQGHRDLRCASCHQGGEYAGLDPACENCHLDDDAHRGQNGIECALCHTISAWEAAGVDHSLLGARDCRDCHRPPTGHYPGACVSCHVDTTSFVIVSFDHATIGDADCRACHSPPANHFPGSCRACHLNTADFQIVQFAHTAVAGTDCGACHTPPPDHFGPPCALCHLDTTSFLIVRFDHTRMGEQDCVACHAPPPNHFPGRCRDCHSDATNFRNATFNHTFPLNHGEANSNCATCHSGNVYSSYTCSNCHADGEMVEEHQKEGIVDIVNCVACHADGQKVED